MKYMRICALVVILCVGLVAFKKLFLVQKSDQELIIGIAAGYAPFISINEYGDYEGFDIEVAKAVAQKLGKKLVLRDLGSMAPLFMALEQERIDAIIWGLSITQDRLKKVAMVRYQGEVTDSYPLLFWGLIPATIHSIADMQGMTVCVEPGSSQDAVLNRYTFIQTLPTEKIDDALLSIQYGKADAALVEPAIAQKFKNKYSEIQLLDVPLDPMDQVQGVGIAIKKNKTALIAQIEAAVNALVTNGTIARYECAWGLSCKN